jgi:predicted regulator of Ras-like GTPase activity (Roadblock/LC7/MglB family)
MVKKRRVFQETAADVAEPIAVEETTPVNNLRATLDEIKTCEGVVGYILRNTTSATIDVKDPAKIIDYAILSSSALDASKQLAELFDLGEPSNIDVEGKNIRMLSLVVDEDKLSVFMEKNVDSRKILKRLHAA